MGTVNFGLDDIVYDFFDHYMKGKSNRFAKGEPRVRYFSMGANEWQTAETWPPPGARTETLYLASDAGANGLAGDGHLSRTSPDEPDSDRFTYDPMNPVPSLGGNLCCLGDALKPGSFDQRPIEARQDVLVYTTPPLEHDLEVTGPISVTLWASTSGCDTDFTAKLVEVCEDGCTRNLTDGIIRARYRESSSEPSLLEPGKVYRYTIDLWSTSNVFKKGHQIRVEVSSSNFPRFDRNTNTGNLIAEDRDGKPALQTIYHDSEHPSHIILPTLPR
jgi:putative CocE/NonD family hydrolase